VRIFSRDRSRHEPEDNSGHPTTDEADEASDERRSRFPLTGKRAAVVASGVLLAFILFGCWLGYQALGVKANLYAARDSAQQARDALSNVNVEEATQKADDARRHAQNARDTTHSLSWNLASAVPWLGTPFTTGQQISDVVLGLATDVLSPSTQVAAAISPDRLLEGGRVNVQLLRNAAPELSKIATAATLLNAQAAKISDPTYISAMSEARTQLQGQISELSELLQNTDLAARLAPSMLGADGRRTYFMGFQTNAEARGTGGLLGGFGIVHFDNGKASVDNLASNIALDNAFASVDLGPDFTQLYGTSRPTEDFRNSNQSSHFPYAAQIWKSMWAQKSGTDVDGVIAVDPIALSYILEAMGPVTMPDGETITADNVVELTESTVYARFPDDQLARKQYLQDVASKVVEHMTAGEVKSPRKLLDALGKALGEGRIAVWSALPEDQQLLEQTPLAHVVPDDPAPFAGVVITNLGGNKLDYYLRPQIEYSADGCEGETRKSAVTVKLTNEAPEGLPDYVADASGYKMFAPYFPRGTNFAAVSLVATKGATLAAVIAKNEKVPFYVGKERGHPVFQVQVGVPPGKSIELSFLLSEPTSPGAPRVPVQPLVEKVTPIVSVPTCGG
jgi:hypothetical protein